MESTRSGRILSALQSDPELENTLPDRLCAMCVSELGISGAAFTLLSIGGHHDVLAVTDGLAAKVEALQFNLGEGPGLDAFNRGHPVLVPHLARSGLAGWPAFGGEAMEAGAEAVFSFPLQVGGIRLGVLSLFRSTGGHLSEDQTSDALAFADAAMAILIHLQEQRAVSGGVHPRLAMPLLDRPELHQATGMISVQAGIGLAESLLLLRAHAYAAERPLLDAARDVVARVLGFNRKPDQED